jgi:hypothetical protein
MPPIVFVAKAVGVLVGGSATFAVPLTTKPGDLMVAIIDAPGPTTYEGDDPLNALWLAADGSLGPLAWLVGGSVVVTVLTRVARADDPATLTVKGDAAMTSLRAVLLVYRGADVAQPQPADGSFVAHAVPAVAWGSTAIAASTNFACPSLASTTYSDLYLGVVVVSTGATAVVPPAGAIERDEQQASARTLEVFDAYPEAVGATGTKTATAGPPAYSGIAIGVLLKSGALPPTKPLASAWPGAIGLPTEGV